MSFERRRLTFAPQGHPILRKVEHLNHDEDFQTCFKKGSQPESRFALVIFATRHPEAAHPTYPHGRGTSCQCWPKRFSSRPSYPVWVGSHGSSRHMTLGLRVVAPYVGRVWGLRYRCCAQKYHPHILDDVMQHGIHVQPNHTTVTTSHHHTHKPTRKQIANPIRTIFQAEPC